MNLLLSCYPLLEVACFLLLRFNAVTAFLRNRDLAVGELLSGDGLRAAARLSVRIDRSVHDD